MTTKTGAEGGNASLRGLLDQLAAAAVDLITYLRRSADDEVLNRANLVAELAFGAWAAAADEAGLTPPVLARLANVKEAAAGLVNYADAAADLADARTPPEMWGLAEHIAAEATDLTSAAGTRR